MHQDHERRFASRGAKIQIRCDSGRGWNWYLQVAALDNGKRAAQLEVIYVGRVGQEVTL